MRIVQVIDTKNDCEKFYSNQKRYKDIDHVSQSDPFVTWSYNPLFEKQKHTYLSIYKKDIRLCDFCNSQDKEHFLSLELKIKNIIKSYMIAKVDLSGECYAGYIPENVLEPYLKLKEQSLKNFYELNKKPPEYDTLSKIHELVQEISLYRNPSLQGAVKYNIFGTKTGRLTTYPGSFPILTLAKEKRVNIKSVRGAFVEFDFNAAEIRTMLALLGAEQPRGDIHSWNVEMLGDGSMAREEMKKKFFAWLYNPKSENAKFNSYYDKDKLLEKYWNGEAITTKYGRKIPSDKSHALNYILQSTTSDLVLNSAHKVMTKLADSLSRIAFVLHDSVIIDCHEADSSKIESLARTFGETTLGRFRTNIRIGKDFYNMKEVGYV